MHTILIFTGDGRPNGHTEGVASTPHAALCLFSTSTPNILSHNYILRRKSSLPPKTADKTNSNLCPPSNNSENFTNFGNHRPPDASGGNLLPSGGAPPLMSPLYRKKTELSGHYVINIQITISPLPPHTSDLRKFSSL